MASEEEMMEVYPQDNVNTLEESVRVRVHGRDLQLSLLLQEDELAPLFSGAAWAGTLVWDAAIYLTRHFLFSFRHELQDTTKMFRVLELGAGIGVPGMAARVAGADHAIVTEQPDLVELMERNIAANASVLQTSDNSSTGISARVLSWGVEETNAYLSQYADEKVDVILSCDCVYEPLYGKSWKALGETMELFCIANPQTIVLMGVERRNADGIDTFLHFIDNHTRLHWVKLEESIGGTGRNVLEIYELRLNC